MDNKFISLGSKVLMAILLIIGVILIKNNLSYNDSSEEPTKNQELFTVITGGGVDQETGEKIPEETTIFSNLVVDNDTKKVYDLNTGNAFELADYAEKKTPAGQFKEEEVDPVLINNYDLGSATVSSVTYTSWLMWGGLILIGGFSIFNIIQNPKRFIRPAIGFGILGILSAICYAMVDKVGTGKIAQTANYTDDIIHYTGFGIALFITLLFIAVGLIIVGSILGMVRYLSK
jgi:hypothetical protein